MDGIIYAIAGDDQIPKLLMSVKSVRMVSNLPVFVYAHLSDRGCSKLVNAGIPYKLMHNTALEPKTLSRLLKTSVHEVTPFSRTMYFDNDMVAVRDPSWIFDELPESGIVFAHDTGKTVSKFSKYATPGKKLDHELYRVFDVSVEPNWSIWNGGLFVFDHHANDFMNSWHTKQMKIAAGVEGWTKRDQGTLIATVWEFGLQDQTCLPATANFLHGLRGGLKYTDGQWMDSKAKEPITNIHLCLAWGKKSSETWRKLYQQIHGQVQMDQYVEKLRGTKTIVVPTSGKWVKPFSMLIDALNECKDSAIEDDYNLCCSEINGTIIGKDDKHAAVILVDGQPVVIDYYDYVNAKMGPLKKIVRSGVSPELVLKCQYRPDHGTYQNYPCPIVPFIYIPTNAHSRDGDYLLNYRSAFLNNADYNKFEYTLFGRLAKHNPRKKLPDKSNAIHDSDVKLIGLNNGKHQIADSSGRLSRNDYFAKMAKSRFCVDAPGGGNITHRLIEAWGMCQPVICPTLKNDFRVPVEAGIHYIPIAHDFSDLADKVAYYESHYSEAMTIAENGMKYYDRYCTRNGIAELFVRIMKEHGIL